jgi:ABC-type sugar transport system permease subunit
MADPITLAPWVMYYIYKTTFSNFDYGMAAAYSVMLLIVVLTVICFQNFGLDKITHYES